MPPKTNIFNTINSRIILVLLVLFIILAIAVGFLNTQNIRNLYEKTYTERLLLTNALMGSLMHGKDIEYFVGLLKSQDDGFKQRQVEFYHNRLELFRLQEEGAPLEEQQKILNLLAEFHAETKSFKNDTYWLILDELKELKQLSDSTYVYVMADIGLKTKDGEPLYTYIFDAEDEGEYSTPEMDGLGTSDIGNDAFKQVFTTKTQTKKAELYSGDFGDLYFVSVPLLNEKGEFVAILGTDLSLDDMNKVIQTSAILLNRIIVTMFVLSVIVIYIVLNRTIANPISSLTQTVRAFAEGNLETPISRKALKQRSEIGTLAHAVQSTLHATTLYLNSIPESVFIMNRNCDTYFRNEQFIKRFGDMQAREFMNALLPTELDEILESNPNGENNSTIVWIDGSCFTVTLKEIVLADMMGNSVLVIANDITVLMKEKENAQSAAAAKSTFLSRMSHEMRTPMNAIIGMTKIAGDSDSLSSIKHCISVIQASSAQLLHIINDVLDMSKIEAGKFELENSPINIEKILMKVCDIIIGSAEKKEQNFNVIFGKGLNQHYIADELRLSQVLTNLLSNAIKFTPENGKITLKVEKTNQRGNIAFLFFSISDTGIGMTSEQVARLFNAFEQADGSITRKYGGTGLGLAISQSIVEKMGGCINVESAFGIGTTFSFTVPFECVPDQEIDLFSDIPSDIKCLIAENDDDIKTQFAGITENFRIKADIADNAEDIYKLLNNRVYDIIFISYEISGENAIDIINKCGGAVDKNSVVLITTYPEWHNIETYAHENNITHHIPKPIFPSSVLDLINEIAGNRLKSNQKSDREENEVPDFSDMKVLLVEDIEINREIFFALMDGTNIAVDTAENGVEAIEKFRTNHEYYDMIIMDIQMPEMDGYEATRKIRTMNDIPKAQTIPIIAMSANAFKEDIERCLECGMNAHLAKPMDIDEVFKKIKQFI